MRTVIPGVGVDENTDGSEVLRALYLETSEDVAVFAEHYLSGQIYAVREEVFEVLVGLSICKSMGTDLGGVDVEMEQRLTP